MKQKHLKTRKKNNKRKYVGGADPFIPATLVELKKAITAFKENRESAIQIYGFMSSWDVSNITDFSGAFFGFNFMNDPTDTISNWNVSNVTNFSETFAHCTQFNQPLNNWNVSNATNMSRMFYHCILFDQPLNDWNVSNVTDFSETFANCVQFNQPLNNWNVSNATNMSWMFDDCMLFDQPLNDWNVSNVTDFYKMFLNCIQFNQPLNNWVVTNCEIMDGMFMFCNSFNQSLNQWNPTSDKLSFINMLFNCPMQRNLDYLPPFCNQPKSKYEYSGIFEEKLKPDFNARCNIINKLFLDFTDILLENVNAHQIPNTFKLYPYSFDDFDDDDCLTIQLKPNLDVVQKESLLNSNCIMFGMFFSFNKHDINLNVTFVESKIKTFGINGCVTTTTTTNMIQQLVESAKKFDHVQKVIISKDGSSLIYYLDQNNRLALSLATLKIMTQGRSWYNKLGFIDSKGNQHELEERWNQLQNIPFIEFLKIMHYNGKSKTRANDDKMVNVILPILTSIDERPNIASDNEDVSKKRKLNEWSQNTMELLNSPSQQVFEKIEKYLTRACPATNCGFIPSCNLCIPKEKETVELISLFFIDIGESNILAYKPYNLTKTHLNLPVEYFRNNRKSIHLGKNTKPLTAKNINTPTHQSILKKVSQTHYSYSYIRGGTLKKYKR